MPSYTYNEPEEREFEVLPEGEYAFTITEVFAFEVAKSGNEYLPLKIAVKSPKGNTVNVFDNLVFTEKAKFRIDQLLKSIGKAPAPGTAEDFDDPTWLVGCKGVVKLKIETYNSNNRNKVDAYLFKKATVEGRMVTTAKRAEAPVATQQEEEHDNIPF